MEKKRSSENWKPWANDSHIWLTFFSPYSIRYPTPSIDDAAASHICRSKLNELMVFLVGFFLSPLALALSLACPIEPHRPMFINLITASELWKCFRYEINALFVQRLMYKLKNLWVLSIKKHTQTIQRQPRDHWWIGKWKRYCLLALVALN